MGKRDFEEYDRVYWEYKKDHPDTTYAQFFMDRVADKIHKGGHHHTLGGNLKVSGGGDKQRQPEFWQSGASAARRYIKTFSVQPENKVVEYGCGSLRIAGHFIKHLLPDRFWGLDVVPDFFEIGKTLIGKEMVAEKRPRFGVIGEEAVAEVEAFAPDFVYSNTVACHVHPDEADTYYGNLARLVHKPGSVLFFNVTFADAPFRYRERGWAWPLEYYRTALKDLSYVETHMAERESSKDGVRMRYGVLEFRRA
jgi:hypothetical protein